MNYIEKIKDYKSSIKTISFFQKNKEENKNEEVVGEINAFDKEFADDIRFLKGEGYSFEDIKNTIQEMEDITDKSTAIQTAKIIYEKNDENS